jgi:NAD(P)-dependent dehydrogenase (short-subunit alcohol dehydrogenase family)
MEMAPGGDRFDGKVALVTGSSRNLGAAIAGRLGAHGATVAVHYQQDAAAAERVVIAIAAQGGAAARFQADLAASGSSAPLAQAVLAQLGRLDILVHAAGPYADIPFAALDESTWDRTMNVNLRAAYQLASVAAPSMREQGWGRIVAISAGSAFIRSHSVYGLAKDALRHLVASLAVELAPEITVNAIAPGQIVDTPLVDEIAPGFKQAQLEATPLRRLVTWSELSTLVVLLCSRPFDMMTGQTLVIDGGWSLPLGQGTPVIGQAL